MLHESIDINLNTMRIEVSQMKENSVIAKNTQAIEIVESITKIMQSQLDKEAMIARLVQKEE